MRVLIIEDDISTAQSLELMLKSERFNVYTTDLGEEGIDLGKVYDYVHYSSRPQSAGHVGL
jgi:two-component system cell cycle response regulator CtrA